MKKLVISAAALAFSAGMGLADTVRMGTEGAYPPYNFINDSGEIDGFERALGDELCTRAELDCTWVTSEWDSIIPSLVSGTYDTIIAAMSINEERKQVIAFTENYLPPAPSSYVALEDGVNLDGAVIAAQTGTVQSAYIAETGATLLEFATIDEVLAAVRNGEADAAFGDHEVVRPYVDESEDLTFVGEQVSLDEGIGIGVRKTDDELREKLNGAIASMKEDGSLNELIKKWFGDDAQTYE